MSSIATNIATARAPLIRRLCLALFGAVASLFAARDARLNVPAFLERKPVLACDALYAGNSNKARLWLALAIAFACSATDANATEISFALGAKICQQNGTNLACDKRTHGCICAYCQMIPTTKGPIKQCAYVTCAGDSNTCSVTYDIAERKDTIAPLPQKPLRPAVGTTLSK